MSKPAYKIRDGLITATIWANWSEAKKTTFYTINIARSYKDKADKWQEDSSFLGDEALRAANLMQQAYNWTLEARAADRREQGQSENPAEAGDDDEIAF